MEINYAIDITSPVNDILIIYGDHYQVQRYTNGLDKISMDMWELTDHDNGWIPDGTGTNLSEESERIYYLEDELGSIIKVIGENGKTSAHYNYDEFGRPLAERKFDQNWPGPDNTFGYTGYQYDVSAGLYYAQARYYMPEIGRFISEDPWPGDITIPQTLNPYPYVVNNPLKYVDPLGLSHKDLGPGGATAPANKPSAVDKTTSKVVRDNTGNNTKYSDCPQGTEKDELSPSNLAAIIIDLGKGWRCREDIGDPSTGTKPHIHIWNDKEGKWSQNNDGSIHDKNSNSKGEPPKSVKKKLKDKTGWDWDENKEQSDDSKKTEITVNLDPASIRSAKNVTGLSGATLIMYFIISEGLHSFPLRNAMPIQ